MSNENPPKNFFMRMRNVMFRMVGLTTEPLIVAVPKDVAQRELNQRASALILELSHQLFDLVPQTDQTWKKAYYRFQCESAGNASAACCKGDGGPNRIGAALQHMDEKAEALVKLFGKSQGVLLLIVGADASYKLDFDWDDLGRWPIADDGSLSGLPQLH